MQVIRYPQKNTWEKLIRRPLLKAARLESTVAAILRDVKATGDKALKELTLKFDQLSLQELQVSEQEIKEAASLISGELIKALNVAAQNIEKFHKAQWISEERIETSREVYCWRRNVAIEKVGFYIPGGTAPLFSTVLMLAIPARIAGCKEIVLCTPAGKKGLIHPAILYAAHMSGINKIFKVGGAQAIAAMAYGTESIPAVDKIFGPGNQFVTRAKQHVNAQGIAIDMPAGPSEVLVVADETAVPKFIAADLLAQAEHGPDSQVIFLTYDENLLEPVERELQKQLKELPRRNYAAKALENSRTIVLRNFDEAMEFSNIYAPEHLILMVKNLKEAELRVVNAGSVFLGNYTPESAGDYASGTNHVLPTNSFARSYSGVSLDSFVRKITFQNITKKGLLNIGPSIEILAEAEELIAHKRSVSLRNQEKD